MNGFVRKAGPVVLAGLLLAPSVRAQMPTHVYTLNNTFTDVLGGPTLLGNGGAFASANGRQGYAFAPNEGPTLSGAIDPSVYTIEMHFSLADVSSNRKLIDFADRTSDRGVWARAGGGYFAADKLDHISPVFLSGQLAHLVVTRDAANVFASYVNGVFLGAFDDATTSPPFAMTFTGPGSVIHFFRDDLATAPTEAGSGFVDYVRIYDRALTSDDVRVRYEDRLNELGGVSTVPEPATAWLLVSTVGFVFAAARRRRTK